MNRIIELAKVDGLEKEKVEKGDGRLMNYYRPKGDGEDS
jgi:hypothetical protein